MAYDPSTVLGALLSSTPDLIFFLDREGRCRCAGKATAAALPSRSIPITSCRP